MCTREKKEKAIAMYDTTQSITEVICRLGYPINRKNGERRYRYQYLFLRYRFFGYLQNNPIRYNIFRKIKKRAKKVDMLTKLW